MLKASRPIVENQYIFKAVTLVLIVAAICLLFSRGATRALEGSWDLTMIYASSRQLVMGADPYDFDATYDTFESAGGTGRPRDPAWFASLYPPFTFAVLSPLGLLHWQGAKIAWLGLNLAAAMAVCCWLVTYRPKTRIRHDNGTPALSNPPTSGVWTSTFACALWLGSGCLLTAMAFGQLSIVTLALMLPLLSPGSARTRECWRWRSVRTAGVGFLLAVAGLLKPQLVAPLALLLLFSSRRPAVVWSMAWGLIFILATYLWLQAIAPNWLVNWQGQLAAFAATGFGDPTSRNPYTYQMINLEPWLHRLWPGGEGPRSLLTLAAVGIPMLGLVLAIAKLLTAGEGVVQNDQELASGDTPANDLLLVTLAFASVITLLLVYHRAYDAVLLVVPGLWAWRRLAYNHRSFIAWIVMACLAAFMLPGPAILANLIRRGTIPSDISDVWLWRAVVMPHQNIALVSLAVTFGWCVIRWKAPGEGGESEVSTTTTSLRPAPREAD